MKQELAEKGRYNFSEFSYDTRKTAIFLKNKEKTSLLETLLSVNQASNLLDRIDSPPFLVRRGLFYIYKLHF